MLAPGKNHSEQKILISKEEPIRNLMGQSTARIPLIGDWPSSSMAGHIAAVLFTCI